MIGTVPLQITPLNGTTLLYLTTYRPQQGNAFTIGTVNNVLLKNLLVKQKSPNKLNLSLI
jgi:hypothetical protein